MTEMWILYATLAMIAGGISMAFLKVPSIFNINTRVYSFLISVISFILGLTLFHDSIFIDYSTMLYAALCAIFLILTFQKQMEVFKKVDVSTILPFTSLSSHVLVIILGIFFFHDHISVIQSIAIISGILFLIQYKNIHLNTHFNGAMIYMVSSIVLFSTANKFTQKYGAIKVDVYNFTFWLVFFMMIASLFLIIIYERTNFLKKYSLISFIKSNILIFNNKKILLYTLCAGICSFVANVYLTKALATGPFSLVYTINSLYLLITSFVAWKLFNEKQTGNKILYICIAIVIILLIKLG